jgi:hypothetical protein
MPKTDVVKTDKTRRQFFPKTSPENSRLLARVFQFQKSFNFNYLIRLLY